jgi:hypothetical protein
MVSPVNIIMVIAATTVAGAKGWKKHCRYPYEQCGWVLANSDYGNHPDSSPPVGTLELTRVPLAYTYDELRAAAGSSDGSRIYDALYRCDPETGALTYINWCVGGCGTDIVPNDNCINNGEE